MNLKENSKIILFWFCLIVLVAILILNLLKGSKEWFDMSDPNTFSEPELQTEPIEQIESENEIIVSEPKYEPILSKPKHDSEEEMHHLQPKADPRLEQLNRSRFDLRTGMPTDLPESPKIQVDLPESTLQSKFEVTNRSQPQLDLKTGLPVELPKITNILSSSTIPIRNGVRGSDIRTLPQV